MKKFYKLAVALIVFTGAINNNPIRDRKGELTPNNLGKKTERFMENFP